MPTYIVREIDDDFYLLRVGDKYTKYFEGLWEIPEGVTYNAYLLKTGEGAILFDGWKATFSGLFIEALENIISPDELKYVVVNHLEPDHSGSLETVLRWAPQAKVIGTKMLARMIRPGYPRAAERLVTVEDGETLELGGERVEFIYAPWLHWPETMLSWLPDRRILITCDVFGGFGIPEGVFDDECAREGDIMRSMKKYVVTVIGKYRAFITKALAKLEEKGVEPRIIAPGHGLLWRGNPRRVIEYYGSIAKAEPVEGKILVVYGSMYGATESLARSISCKLRLQGYKPVEYAFTDSYRSNISDILTDAIDSQAIIIAAPTYEAEAFPIIDYVAEELCKKAAAPKPVFILSHFGWGGVAAKLLDKKLSKCGFKTRILEEEKLILPAGGMPDPRLVEKLASTIEEILEQDNSR